MNSRYRARPGLACVALVCSMSVMPVANAQVEEVIVTTRKREENLQEVPIAVTALGAEQIERQGITNLGDIAQLVPSVQFDTAFGPQDTRVTIRGLSNTRGRSNVAFLVDGIDVTTENVISAGSGLLANKRLLSDVERIEVVKGPQSALYGRAAFAGAISYVTKEPGDELEGVVRIDAADFGRLQLDGAVGGPVLPGLLGLRLSGVKWSEDGYYTNSVSGDDVGGGDGYGTALAAVLTPTDNVKIKARVEYSDEDYAPTPTVPILGATVRTYPQNAVNAGVGISTAFSGTATTLIDFGVYCPSGAPVPPDSPPGICLPRSFGSAAGRQVSHSENPFTGGDFPGSTIELMRTTLVADWDLGAVTLSSYTGYTDATLDQLYDQDYQARGRPDQIISEMITDTHQETTQFSQELRATSSWDGPVQLTVGGLYWHEERDLDDRNSITACLPITTDFLGNFVRDVAGVCDGTAALGGLVSIASWQDYVRQDLTPDVPGFLGPVWNTDTEHMSAYLSVDWAITDTVSVTLEDRYIYEKFEILRPNQASCAALGFTVLGGSFVAPLVSEAANPGEDVNCESYENARIKVNRGMDPNGPEILNPFDPGMLLDWALISGAETSRFHTPKVTLNWQATDDALVYFSWAKAQKPGGINQLEAGGSPTVIENERFASEKMTAWELGAKTTWSAAGYLQLNGAAFYQDYSDKQVTTQVLIDDKLAPRVTNASSADIWGLEFDLVWQPDVIDGLTLGASYTWLDPQYQDYLDDTTVLPRAAAAGCSQVVYKGGLGDDPSDLTDPANGAPTCRIDQSGKQLERTPENSFVGTVNLQRPFSGEDLSWFVGLSASYQDKRYLDVDNFTYFDDFWLLNLQLGLTGDKWELVGYIDNLLDDDTIRTGGSGPEFGQQVTELGFVAGLGVQFVFAPLPDPRVFGVRLSRRF
ncbi:MAG: TonB-dependent receptor [Chromatiales bacterium]|nr:TonB-dependent receptor [Chromatiales bacterium]